jgi:V/A-type H+-transporting ATPase subunit C
LYITPGSFKQDVRFACAVGMVRVLETTLLSKSILARLLDASDEEELFKILSDTDYEQHVTGPEDIHEFEDFLAKELVRVLGVLRWMSPDSWWIDLFCRRYDFHNLKIIFKARQLEEDPASALIPTGLVDLNMLQEAVKEKEYDKLPIELKNAALRIESHLEKGANIQAVDIMADHALYAYLYQETKRDIFLGGLIRIYCDLINIKTFLRIRNIGGSLALLRESLLPVGELDEKRFIGAFDLNLEEFSLLLSSTSYAEVVTRAVGDFIKEKTFSTLEKLSDNFVLEYLSQSRAVVFGKEPLVSYLLLKENEIKILRILLVGKLNHLPAVVIKERLRNTYG